ncbi:MAG: nucleotidyl transferase AbiEii/AbiGii toxin family protein [Candidatus Omnitrophica bacterium]|nr:nucleotidyl transferase AbiEii/AbiGii toxin family protein [Candidatus Omnitrophota bacterium]MCM8833142.1 nucleotidyl transferase AbiEii/AbiGii toxin family protein [Candidatus Omnitrophota bacterium]
MFQNLLKKIARELSKLEIPYMIIGGQAVLLYGEPRLTKDIDVTLGVGIEKLKELKILSEKLQFKILVDNPDDFVRKTMVLPLQDIKSGIRIDFIFSFSSYENQAIKKAVEIKFGRISVKFAALEDVIIHKIIAGRSRDIEDVKSIILKNPSYDKNYIINWLREFDRSLNEKFESQFQNVIKELE